MSKRFLIVVVFILIIYTAASELQVDPVIVDDVAFIKLGTYSKLLQRLMTMI